MAAIPIDLDDFDTDDDDVPLVPINNNTLHAIVNIVPVKEESFPSVLPLCDDDDDPVVEPPKCEGDEDGNLPKTQEDDAPKLLSNEQQLCVIKALSESSNPDDTMAKLRDSAINKQSCFGMEPLSLEQTAEGIRAWELATLPSVTELNLPWVYPGRKARIPNRRIQTSFFCPESRAVLVGESTALALRCHAHPDDVVETAATGYIRLPTLPEDFVLRIKCEVVYRGLLSSPQLESVAYAARRFTQTLPDGCVQGYCLGDGTGCGKGRIIAALIIHLWNHGFRRHIWISVSKDLIQDAKRDLKDLLAASIPVFDITDGARDGVAFSTYALLGRRQGNDDGLKDFYDFFGRDGGGLLCFDEAHKAKNLRLHATVNSAAKKKGKKQGSKSARAVEEMQRLLPNAKVLYSSATAATEICHMGYMTRLGLWGPKKSFPNFKIFENNMSGGGVAAMEMLAVNMKAMGMLSCRSLAYTGISFEVIHTQILPRQKEMYDGSVAVFRELKGLLKTYLSSSDSPITRAYLHKKKALFWMSYFYSVQQRFFKQLLVAFKVDEAVKLASMALADNNQVVLSMWGTGAARLDAKLKETEKQRRDDGMSPTDHEDLLSGPEMTLEHAIEQLILPLNKNMKKQQKDLITQVKSLKLPANALDDLIDKLGGPDRVAEMSGRSSRLLRNKDDANGPYQYVSRTAGRDSSGDGVNLMEQRHFQNGTKRVAIITEAASTGISLHADNRIQNKRRRLMITLELPWGADKAIQQFGRVHRSNQHVPPRFLIVLTPVGGEVRFASTIAQRLKWLGAMTKGDRNIGMGGDLGDKLSDFDVHNVYGKRALSQFFQDLRSAPSDDRKDLYEVAIQPHVGDEDYELFAGRARSMLEFVDLNDSTDKKSFQKVDELIESSTMNQFLNRILMFPLTMQNAVFDCFMAVYDELVTKDKEAGEFSEAQVSLNQQLLTISLHTREHVHYDKSGAVSDLVTLQLDRGVAWETGLKLYDVCTTSTGDENEGFYHFYAHCSKIKEVVLIRQSPKRRTYEMITPHNGVKTSASANYITKAMLGNTAVFRRITDLNVAKEGWDWQRNISCEKCIHIQRGFKCIKGDECKEGKRLLLVTLLSGAFLEVWGFLSQHISELSHRTKRNNTKTLPLVSVRVENRTIVGVRLAPESVEEVSYVLRNMLSDAEQSDEETLLGIIALYKAEKIQPFCTWIEAHKAMTPRVARSKEGLHSVKATWAVLKASQLIQELVGGGTTCRVQNAEAYWMRRWGQFKEENMVKPVEVKPKPAEVKTKLEINPFFPGRANITPFDANECMAISDDDSDDSVASVGSSRAGKVAKTEPSPSEPPKKMSPWETLQHLAQKRMAVKAQQECDPAGSANDGMNKNGNVTKLSEDRIDIDDGASSTSSTSSSISSSSSGSSLVFISGNTAPVPPVADDIKPKENELSTVTPQTGAVKETKEENRAVKSIHSADVKVDGNAKVKGDITAEKLRKRMKKVQKLKKWMAQQGREEWMQNLETRRGNETGEGAKRNPVEEDQTPLNILSLADRRNLMREHADSNMQSPKSRPKLCEDELLHMLYTPPKMDNGHGPMSAPMELDDPFALNDVSDGTDTDTDTDTDITNRFFQDAETEPALSDHESDAGSDITRWVTPESPPAPDPSASDPDSRDIHSRGVKRELPDKDGFMRAIELAYKRARRAEELNAAPSTSSRGTQEPTICTTNGGVGSGSGEATTRGEGEPTISTKNGGVGSGPGEATTRDEQEPTISTNNGGVGSGPGEATTCGDRGPTISTKIGGVGSGSGEATTRDEQEPTISTKNGSVGSGSGGATTIGVQEPTISTKNGGVGSGSGGATTRGEQEPTISTKNGSVGSGSGGGATTRGTKRFRVARASSQSARAADSQEAWCLQMRRLVERERRLLAEWEAIKRDRARISNGSKVRDVALTMSSSGSYVPSKTRTVIERSFSFPPPNGVSQSDAATSSSSKPGAMLPETQPAMRSKPSGPSLSAAPVASVTESPSGAFTSGRIKTESDDASSSSSPPKPLIVGSLGHKVFKPQQWSRLSEAVAGSGVQKPGEIQPSFSRLSDAVAASTSSSGSCKAPTVTQLKLLSNNNNNINNNNSCSSNAAVKLQPEFSCLSHAVASSSSRSAASPGISTDTRSATLSMTTRQLLRAENDAKNSKEAQHYLSRAGTSSGNSVPVQSQNAWHPSHLTATAMNHQASDSRSPPTRDTRLPTIASSSRPQAMEIDYSHATPRHSQVPTAASHQQRSNLRERLERAKMANHLKMLRGYLRQHDVRSFTDLIGTKTDFTQKDEGRTLLHEAILAGNADAVENLLAVADAARCMLEETDRTGANPLHAALRLQRPLKIVEVLMRHSPSLTARDANNRTALDIAQAINGDHPQSEALCALLNPNSAKSLSSTAHGNGGAPHAQEARASSLWTNDTLPHTAQTSQMTSQPASSSSTHADGRTADPPNSSLQQQPHNSPRQQQDSHGPSNGKEPFDAVAAGYV